MLLSDVSVPKFAGQKVRPLEYDEFEKERRKLLNARAALRTRLGNHEDEKNYNKLCEDLKISTRQ